VRVPSIKVLVVCFYYLFRGDSSGTDPFIPVFNFDDGRAFEPDFVLFLIKENESPALHYQVFIEPKGQQLLKADEWKHNFLMQLKTKHKIEQLWKDREYIVWGMPFYNETETKPEFESEFNSFM